jgi:CubicO group peptidase (beta-lactamase class C family)
VLHRQGCWGAGGRDRQRRVLGGTEIEPYRKDEPSREKTLMSTKISAAARLVAVVALGTLSTLALAGFMPFEAQSDARPELAALTGRLDQDEPLIMAALNVPGAAVAVVRDGENVWSTGYGLASVREGTEVSADTVFQVGSISKTLTAWGVMHLVETGQVSLDAPIESYLTRWAFPPSAYDSSGATVSRVLNHTTGLNRVDGYPLPGDQPLPSLEEHLDGNNGGGQGLRIDMEPGRQFNYSNAGYTLLHRLHPPSTDDRRGDRAAVLRLHAGGHPRPTWHDRQHVQP